MVMFSHLQAECTFKLYLEEISKKNNTLDAYLRHLIIYIIIWIIWMVKIIWILGSEIIHKKKQYRMAIADLIPCVLFICLFVVVFVFDCFCPSSQGVKDLKKLTRYFSELLLPMWKYFTLLRMLQMRTRIPASQRTYISRHPYQDRSCWSM